MQLIETVSSSSRKFADPDVTADGKARASVSVRALETLWLNTGTLCNLTCENCYIQSSPRNDSLAYLSRDDVADYLEEIELRRLPVEEIGITGGEPFMNPHILPILEDCLRGGFSVLVLTNAMRPMMKCARGLLRLNRVFADRLTIRVSLDHYERSFHEEERGTRTWQQTIEGMQWLSESGFRLRVAGRTRWGDEESELRAGFAGLFTQTGIALDACDPNELVLFPEMDECNDVPEITTECWDILGVRPDDLMCSNARMVVRRKGAAHPEVVACTLLPYDPQFSLGRSLAGSLDSVALNHPHCAKFCVLGGGSCSP